MPNTLKIKRGTAATIPQGQLAEPLFTTDTYDLYIGKGSGGNQRIQNYIASGTSSQFLKGDGSLDSTTYQTALTFTSPLVNTSGTVTINQSSGSANGYLSSTDWTTFNSKEPAITAGTTSQYYRGDKTFQTLDTAAVPENGAIYFTEPRVRATVLTGLNLSGGGTIAATDSVLTAFGKVQNQISALVGGATYQGTWNASTNTPTLASGTGTKGYYYVVSVAGSTNLDGITDWKIGDWAIFNGTTWDKVDNTDAVSSVNGFTGAVNLALDNISDVSAASPTNAQLLRFNGTSSLWENWTPTYISAAITSLNGLTAATQTFATGTTGTDFNISSSSGVHTFNIPSASAANRGLVTIGAQTFAGDKTFVNDLTIDAAGDGYIKLWNAYSGTPSNPGIEVKNYNGDTTFSHNSNGGGTIINGKTAINKSLEDYAFTVSNTNASGYGAYIRGGGTQDSLRVYNYDESTLLFKVTGSGAGVFNGSVTASISALATSSDAYVVSDSGTLKKRTAAQVLSDIGAQPLLTNPVTGTGSANQIAYWTASGITGSSTFSYNPTSKFTVNNTVTAASAIARGTHIQSTLVAAANNDVLIAFDIDPTFTNGAFTGVNNIALRVIGNTSISGTINASNFSGSSSGTNTGDQDLSGYVNGSGTQYQLLYFTATGSAATGSTNIKTDANGGLKFGVANSATQNYFSLNHKDGVDGGLLLNRDNSTNDWQIINASTTGNLNFYSYGTTSEAFVIAKATGAATFYGKTNVTNSIADYGFTVTNSKSDGYGAYIRGGGTNDSLRVYNYDETTLLFKVTGVGAGVFASSVTASSIVKSGGTSSQYLMADGSTSTLTNPVTGTGTQYQIPYFTGTGSPITGSSNIVTDANGGLTIGASNSSSANFLNLNKKDGVDGGILIRRDNTGNDWQITNLSTSGDLQFYSYGTADYALRLTKSTGAALFGSTITAKAGSIISSASNSDWGFTVINSGTTNANGLYAQIGDTSTGVPFLVQKGSTDYFRIANNGAITLGGALSGTSATFSGNVTVNAEELTINKAGGSFLTLKTTNTTDTQYIQFSDNDGAAGSIFYNHTNNSLTAKVNGTNQLTISSTGAATFSSSVTAGGSVGVGGTNTDSLLTVNGTAGTSHQRFREGSTTVGFVGGANGIITGHNGKLALRGESGLVLSGQGNSADMVILSNGNTIFYGKTSISKVISDYAFTVVNTQTDGYGMYLQAGGANNAIDVYNAAGTTQIFKLTGTGAGTFNSSLTVVGTSSLKGSVTINPDSQNAGIYLTVNKKGTQDGGVLLSRDMTYDWQWVNNTTTGDLNFYSYGVGNTVMLIKRSNGNVLIGSTTDGTGKLQVTGSVYATSGFYDTSDLRIKNILERNPNVKLDLDLVKYIKKDDEFNTVRYGYIAQEVQKLMPELVGGKDTLSLNYQDVHSVLIYNLMNRIKQLESKLN